MKYILLLTLLVYLISLHVKLPENDFVLTVIGFIPVGCLIVLTEVLWTITKSRLIVLSIIVGGLFLWFLCPTLFAGILLILTLATWRKHENFCCSTF